MRKWVRNPDEIDVRFMGRRPRDYRHLRRKAERGWIKAALRRLAVSQGHGGGLTWR